MNPYRPLVCLALLVQVACVPPRRLADPSSIGSLWDGDAECVAGARAAGSHQDRAEVQVWVHPQAPWAAELADAVAAGVRAARNYLSSRGLQATATLEVYACDRKTIAHAPGGPFVFLSRSMVEECRAPWLHEAMHVLLRGGGREWLTDFDEATVEREMPLWLVEGLTEFLAQTVSEEAQVASAGPFSARLADLDAACAAAAGRGPAGILEYVGRRGRPPDWFGAGRFERAKVFYPCSTSLVAWLARRHGVPALVDAHRSTPGELARWEAVSGATLEAERAAWTEHLALAGK